MATAEQDPLLAAKAAALQTLQNVSVQQVTPGGKAAQAEEELESVGRAALWSPGAAASLASDLPQPLFPDEVYDAALAAPEPAAANGAAGAAAPTPEVQQPAAQPGPALQATNGIQQAAQEQGAPVSGEAAVEVEQPTAGAEATAAAAANQAGAGEGDPALPPVAAARDRQGSADAATLDGAAGDAPAAPAADDAAAAGSAGTGGAVDPTAVAAGEAGSAAAPPAAAEGQQAAQPSPGTQAAHAAAAQQYAAAYYSGGYGDPSAAAWAAYGYGASGYYGSGYDYGAAYYGGYSGGPCVACCTPHLCLLLHCTLNITPLLLGLPSSARLLAPASRQCAPACVGLGAGLRRPQPPHGTE